MFTVLLTVPCGAHTLHDARGSGLSPFISHDEAPRHMRAEPNRPFAGRP